MPTIEQVVEAFKKDPAETFGRLLAAINGIHERLAQIEEIIIGEADNPENWDKEETHLS